MTPLKVLSLFDGMSCGQIALGRAGIPVDTYYASEVDGHAEQVCKTNWPETVHLGDVTHWRGWDVIHGMDLSEIDLIIGGSPCQGFSRAGAGKAFDDPRSALLMDYVDILEAVKSVNPDAHFLLENVSMKKEHLTRIDHLLGVLGKPVNSYSVVPQNRVRYYWTSWDWEALSGHTDQTVGDILSDHVNEKYDLSDKAWAGHKKRKAAHEKKGNGFGYCLVDTDTPHTRTLVARYYKDGSDILVGREGGNPRRLSPEECERLQTVPVGYSRGLADRHRYKMLGNGWTVDVIADILSWLHVHDSDLI